jgi:hypothetical protein
MMVHEFRTGGLQVNPLVRPPLLLDLFEVRHRKKALIPAMSAFLDELRTVADGLEREMSHTVHNGVSG